MTPVGSTGQARPRSRRSGTSAARTAAGEFVITCPSPLNVLNNSYGRMYLWARSVEMGTKWQCRPRLGENPWGHNKLFKARRGAVQPFLVPPPYISLVMIQTYKQRNRVA
jgi:hypothetical protein